MHEPELPHSVLTAIEQRVRQCIRRRVIMALLTPSLFFAWFMAATTPSHAGGHQWGMASGLLLMVWLPYALWFIYRALVERGVQREIAREHQRRLELAREAGWARRGEHFAYLAGLEDEEGAYLADDGELWIEDDLLVGSEFKPKRHLNG